MADLPSEIEKINDVEVDADKPVTTALMTKMGSSINGLIDQFGKFQYFTANGNFTVPENVTRILVFAWGGGGGGGGGGQGGDLFGTPYYGGGGGGGSVPRFKIMLVSPEDVIPITIGAGGAGGAGSSGTVGGHGVVGGDTMVGTALFKGGPRGERGGLNLGRGGVGTFSASETTSSGGKGTATANPVANGEDSIYGSGGLGGAGNGSGHRAGGGGGAGYGDGADGGDRTSGAQDGDDAAANTGAGGGGGTTGGPGGDGGSGGSGGCIIFW